MIEIKNLTKEYEGKKVVDELSLSVKKGSIFGFLGPNGAGKTTTIKMIVGLSGPTSGDISVGYRSDKVENSLTSSANKRYIDKSIIGYMPEDPYFYDRLIAKEFLSFMADLFPAPMSFRAILSPPTGGSKEARNPNTKSILSKISPTTSLGRNDRISELLKTVGLGGAANQKIGNFSKGMKQRLGLAQAIINDPEYLFLDEPLDGLDPIGRLEFKKIILDLKNKGKTIFFNSHVLSDVEEICDEIGILNKGKLIYAGSVKKFAGNDSLEKKFVEVIQNIPADKSSHSSLRAGTTGKKDE